MLNSLRKNFYLLSTSVSCLVAIFWYFNFSFWHITSLNFLFLIVYFYLNSFFLGKILGKILNLEKEFEFIFGLFFLVYLLAFLLAIPIVLYRLSHEYLFIVLFLLPIVSFLLSFTPYFRKEEKQRRLFEKEENGKKVPLMFYFIIILASFFCFTLLLRARTGGYIRTPWTNIHPLYFESWLLLIFVFGLMIFKKLSFKKFLILLIFIFFVSHLFLAIPYKAGFGGDKWRHLGAEKWLAEGNIYSPSLFGEKIEYRQIGPLKIPEVFLVGNKTSYSNFWGATIAFSSLTGIDFFSLDLILCPLLFSIFLPFLMLKLGTFISRKKDFLYLFSFSPLLFSPFFIYGGITVPVSFALLPFLFSLIFLFRYLKGEKNLSWLLLSFLFLVPFLYFNYILYLTLFFALFSLSFFVKKTIEAKGFNKTLFLIGLLFVILSLSFFFVFLDAAEDYSSFDWSKINLGAVGQSLKDFGTRLLTSQPIFPRVFEMEQDNWLYATTQSELSRSILLKILPWSLLLTPIILSLAIFGMASSKKMDTPLIGLVLFLTLLILLLNQFTASYLMDGNHIFTKRSVCFISFLFAIFVSWGVYSLIVNNKVSRLFSQQAIIFTLVLILSLVSATVYASGPKSQVVTGDELSSSYYLWDRIKEENNPCVLANTWPLLALEMVSDRRIVAGGFPVYYEYAQPERVYLFENMNKTPTIRYLERAIKITGSSKCFFVTEERFIIFKDQGKVIGGIKKILGEPKAIGEVLIWTYEPNK